MFIKATEHWNHEINLYVKMDLSQPIVNHEPDVEV